MIAELVDASCHTRISELARRGLEARGRVGTRQGFPVFQVSKGAAPLTPEDVRRDQDEG